MFSVLNQTTASIPAQNITKPKPDIWVSSGLSIPWNIVAGSPLAKPHRLFTFSKHRSPNAPRAYGIDGSTTKTIRKTIGAFNLFCFCFRD